ncbi:hypothetical protein ENSA5_33950 [Enhygromyxa salina]|uniref:Lipoprotein n=1 Tax=Enhygromyxa salina TaxID=215803 RepID=A0A2S9XXC3_9BACT|nr:hypothetical protein [Enhygromyxa salina]PRP97502.1 hypothetical protein ENSA5_33950 [Enhygromyxa salina]
MASELLAMANNPCRLTAAVLAACTCLPLIASACVRDEPATYLPRAGTWTYAEQSVVRNSCDDSLLPDPLMTVAIDDPVDDQFQIEVGTKDVICEIDGTEFYCGDYLAFSGGVDGFDATVQIVVTWDGEFSSSTEADGNELTSITCTGEDCNLLKDLPCSRDATFTAEFFN